MIVTYQNALDFIARPKRTTGPLQWQRKPSNKLAQWFEAMSPIEIDGVIHEQTRVILQWRSPAGSRLEMYNFGLLYFGERVFAIDYDPDKHHFNHCGAGMPHYKKRIGPGTHIHRPVADGFGYATPVSDFPNFEQLFSQAVTDCTLDVQGGFQRPPQTQIDLPL